jgi:hypothetical protein
MDPKLELLRPGQDVDLRDDRVNALWPLLSMALDPLASLVPLSLAYDPLDNVE